MKLGPIELKPHTHRPRWAFFNCRNVGWTLWLWSFHITWFNPDYKALSDV